MFLATAFKEEVPTQPDLNGLGLSVCDVCIMLQRVEGVELSTDRHIFKNKVNEVKVKSSYPRVFSRGVAEAVEAVIHATGVKAFRAQGRRRDADSLEKKVEQCIDVVRRVSAAGSPESRSAP